MSVLRPKFIKQCLRRFTSKHNRQRLVMKTLRNQSVGHVWACYADSPRVTKHKRYASPGSRPFSLLNDRLNAVSQDIGRLATFSEFYGEIDDAAIYVQGNVIQWVGQTSLLPEQYQNADEVISLPDRVVIPGLVNTHHHMYVSPCPM